MKRTKKGSVTKRTGVFPLQLYDMLDDASKHGFDHIISWLADGTGFRVHRPTELVNNILPLYFGQQKKYKSFQRQLNMYEFKMLRKVAKGSKHAPHKGAFFHPLFIRGERDASGSILRKSVIFKDEFSGAPRRERNSIFPTGSCYSSFLDLANSTATKSGDVSSDFVLQPEKATSSSAGGYSSGLTCGAGHRLKELLSEEDSTPLPLEKEIQSKFSSDHRTDIAFCYDLLDHDLLSKGGPNYHVAHKVSSIDNDDIIKEIISTFGLTTSS